MESFELSHCSTYKLSVFLFFFSFPEEVRSCDAGKDCILEVLDTIFDFYLGVLDVNFLSFGGCGFDEL